MPKTVYNDTLDIRVGKEAELATLPTPTETTIEFVTDTDIPGGLPEELKTAVYEKRPAEQYYGLDFDVLRSKIESTEVAPLIAQSYESSSNQSSLLFDGNFAGSGVRVVCLAQILGDSNTKMHIYAGVISDTLKNVIASEGFPITDLRDNEWFTGVTDESGDIVRVEIPSRTDVKNIAAGLTTIEEQDAFDYIMNSSAMNYSEGGAIDVTLEEKFAETVGNINSVLDAINGEVI